MTTHRYRPTVYHNVLGPLDPVLTLLPGDRVITTTLDAHGYDEHSEKLAEKPNPMTGPFAVSNTVPGDALVVYIEAAEPNRDSGWTSSVLRPNVVEPLHLKGMPDKEYCEWKLDLDAGWATYTDGVAAGEDIRLPLSPMIGCIGVAPSDGQTISTITCGSHGGNMDYRGIVPGTTLYFPVYTENALLFLGDGHALQSEGEISGTGIETSFAVTFRVDVLKSERISWPRGENDEYLFTIGNAAPLEEALRHATTEMIRWLDESFHMGCERINLFLGHAAEFDVGNVISPHYTMVCKISKKLL
jgi:acetamidase/formamidase